jgi:drug/metabolite transporter (DMT)-like permease
MNSYTFSIALTVLANVGYHLCQKSINQGVSPLISLIATYAVALLTALIAAPFFGTSLAWASFRELNWASYGLGFGILLLELGFLLAYRAGWNLSTAALASNVTVALVLLPIGLLAFREQLNAWNWAGVILALAAIVLIGKK